MMNGDDERGRRTGVTQATVAVRLVVEKLVSATRATAAARSATAAKKGARLRL